MNLNKIKSLLPSLSLALVISFSSCTDDLNVVPIDPSVSMEFKQDQVFTKIYATMGLTGLQGPAGMGDVDGIDEGTSGFVRLIWNLNELTTDEAICSWGDPGIAEMNFCNWSASHDQLKGLYGRLYFDITLCNQFLEMAEGATDAKTVKQRAEVRFMRALNYYYALDMFGNVPFPLKISLTPAAQIKRADLYAFLQKELSEIESDMSEPKAGDYGRADKAANWLLRSRLFLNAQVYTGTPDWANAALYAKKVMDTDYKVKNTPYAHLFMADNDGFESTVNKAKEEILLPIAADGVRTRSFAGSQFIVASTHTEGMLGWGTSAGWGGNRARKALVLKFFPNGIPTTGLEDLSAFGDERALFYAAEDRTVEITAVEKFKQGLSVAKFSNVRADGKPSHDAEFVDMDMPFLRASEANLTFAEATLRAGGVKKEALDAVNVLRNRAGARLFNDISLDDVLDEKSREFYFEGHRRTDLIRYGYYGGSSYNWDWKGGVAAGTQFDKKYNLFPIPASDLNANSNLVQNPGY